MGPKLEPGKGRESVYRGSMSRTFCLDGNQDVLDVPTVLSQGTLDRVLSTRRSTGLDRGFTGGGLSVTYERQSGDAATYGKRETDLGTRESELTGDE